MKPHRFHREADAEFTDALLYYSALGAELSHRFYDEIHAGLAEVSAHPLRFRQTGTAGAPLSRAQLPLRSALHRRT